MSAEKKEAIRERRLKVWRLRVVQKLTLAEIASAVRVSHGTVENDLAVMRRTRTDHVRRAQAAHEASLDAGIEVIEECDAVSRQAWSDLLAAPRGSATRAKFMTVLLTALQRRNEILQSLGMLDRAAEEVILDSSIRDLTDIEADKLIARLKAEIRACDEPAPRGKATPCRAA
jgi:DNA-directed RNA polymerase specialized sigma24 family protein